MPHHHSDRVTTVFAFGWAALALIMLALAGIVVWSSLGVHWRTASGVVTDLVFPRNGSKVIPIGTVTFSYRLDSHDAIGSGMVGDLFTSSHTLGQEFAIGSRHLIYVDAQDGANVAVAIGWTPPVRNLTAVFTGIAAVFFGIGWLTFRDPSRASSQK